MEQIEEDLDFKALKDNQEHDVESAMSLLHAQWPYKHLAPAVPTIFLLNQIYFLVGDRTLVDRELSSMQSRGQCRFFKLFASGSGSAAAAVAAASSGGGRGSSSAASAGGESDLCLCRTEEYVASIQAMIPQTDAKPSAASLQRPSSLPVSSSSSPSSRSHASLSSKALSSAAATSAIVASEAASPSVATPASAPLSTPSIPFFSPWPSSRSPSTAASASVPPLSSSTRSSSASASSTTSAPVSRHASNARPSLPRSASSLSSSTPPTRSNSSSGKSSLPSPSSASSSVSATPIRRKRKSTITNAASVSDSVAKRTKQETKDESADLMPMPPLESIGTTTPRSDSTNNKPLANPTSATSFLVFSPATKSTSRTVSLPSSIAPPSTSSSSSRVAKSGDANRVSDSSTLVGVARGTASTWSGLNRKLLVPLIDCQDDPRFPRLATPSSASSSHPSSFQQHDARIVLDAFARVVASSGDSKHTPPASAASASVSASATGGVTMTLEALLSTIYYPNIRCFHSLTTEQCVSILLHYGLILLKRDNSFWIIPPGLGRLVKDVREARREMVQFIRRKTYHEISLKELRKNGTRKLKHSMCNIDFHLREMLGSEEQIRAIHTTGGTIIRLA